MTVPAKGQQGGQASLSGHQLPTQPHLGSASPVPLSGSFLKEAPSASQTLQDALGPQRPAPSEQKPPGRAGERSTVLSDAVSSLASQDL